MVRRKIEKLAFIAMATALFGATSVQAADITDVLDAADEVYLEGQLVKDPFDISVTPSFRQRIEKAKLKREFADTASSTVRLLNELEYKRIVNVLDIDLEIGLFHDLSFRMGIPIVISDQQSYKFDTSSDNTAFHVTKNSSWFSPSTIDASRPYRFFDLDTAETLNGVKRSGLGDISFGLAWSPYNSERHFIPERPWEGNSGRSTVILAFDYVAPTGKARAIDNSDVGSGVHEFIFSVAASHRYKFVDPYVGLKFGLPLGTSKVFKDFGPNQIRKEPGMWGRFDLGIEFIAYESLKLDYQRLVKIDLRAYAKYTSEGRVMSELMDAFGKGDCAQGTAGSLGEGCGYLAQRWSNAGSQYSEFAQNGASFTGLLKEDGIYDNEGYATVGGAINLVIQPVQYLQIFGGASVDYSQNHFITFTKVGRDRYGYEDGNRTNGGDGVVSDTIDELNPTYSKVLDKSGSRIKRTESLNIEWFVGLKLMY